MLYYERKFQNKGFNFIIGVDEAGRGPLAGPVVAAAVSLTKTRFQNRIDDSKKLSASQRDSAYPEIVENSIFGIGIVNERVIDRLNILVSARIAMEQAIASLIRKIRPHQKTDNRVHILVDGNMSLETDFPYTSIIKGDAKSQSIAAASILAKVARDRIMSLYDKIYPEYGFMRHKGYPTKGHRLAIKEFGLSLIHRKTFCCE